MSNSKITIAEYRHRGLECMKCGSVLMLFGVADEPADCTTCGTEQAYFKKWDHKVKSETTTEEWAN